MNEYYVTFVYELVNVGTVVFHDDEEGAVRAALIQVAEQTGIDGEEAQEITVEMTGHIGRTFGGVVDWLER